DPAEAQRLDDRLLIGELLPAGRALPGHQPHPGRAGVMALQPRRPRCQVDGLDPLGVGLGSTDHGGPFLSERCWPVQSAAGALPQRPRAARREERTVQRMRETPEDMQRLQSLLDASYARAGTHLLGIHTPETRLTAEEVVA